MWWEIPWNPVKFPIENCVIKTFHVFCPKRGFKSSHFIDNATQAPDIAFWSVLFVFPYFWGSIVWSTGLSSGKTRFCYFWYVKITKFSSSSIFRNKYIRTFKISVENFHIMQCFKPSYYMQKVSSYYTFWNIGFLFSVSIYFLQNVSSSCILHDDA